MIGDQVREPVVAHIGGKVAVSDEGESYILLCRHGTSPFCLLAFNSVETDTHGARVPKQLAACEG
jgi:hypothetical protein